MTRYPDLDAADRIRHIIESHVKGYRSTSDEVWDRQPICQECGQAWPCDTAVIIGELP